MRLCGGKREALAPTASIGLGVSLMMNPKLAW